MKNTNCIHFVGSGGWGRNIFHCTKMAAAFSHAEIKIKLTALALSKIHHRAI
jgi:hypothetical protein